jgi:hypothetical protein
MLPFPQVVFTIIYNDAIGAPHKRGHLLKEQWRKIF